jgi:hypothetical protein
MRRDGKDDGSIIIFPLVVGENTNNTSKKNHDMSAMKGLPIVARL